MFTFNQSGDHGVSNQNLLDFTFLLVNFGKVLCLRTSTSKTQMLLLEKNIIHKINIDCFVVDSSH